MSPAIETSALKNLHLCGVISSLSLDISFLNSLSYLILKPFSSSVQRYSLTANIQQHKLYFHSNLRVAI